MNILSTIGHTPLVKIEKVFVKPGVEIWAKLEGFNPTGSIKDRIALKMIAAAENSGQLTHDKIVIEATSGNTGISLAMICAIKGYRLEIAMSEAVSIERRKLIEAYGGKVILTPSEQGTDGAIRYVRDVIKNNPSEYFSPDQFSNKYNTIAHYKTTAEEIWNQTGGKITHFVSAIGTSGTLMGVGKGLKENGNVRVIEAQPSKGHYIQGLKNYEEAIIPSIYDSSIISERIMIDTEQAFAMARRLIREEGLGVGMSSGAAMLAAVEVANKLESGLVVTIFADRSEKYLSTVLF